MTTPHTPLELFLFFQSLLSLGVEPAGFTKISEALKQNEFVHDNETYEPTRLEPDSLKNLYLQLLKEEARNDVIVRGSPIKDGESNPKKRKRSTPPLETVDEAAEHIHLLPQLFNRLYTRYREHAIKAIEEDERKYRVLQQDIHEIEKGDWDSRLQSQDTNSRSGTKGVSSIQTLLRHDSEEFLQDEEKRQQGLRSAGPPALPLQSGQDPLTPQLVNGHSHSISTTGDPNQPSPYSSNRPDGSRVSEHGGQHSRNSSTSAPQRHYSPNLDSLQSLSRTSSQSHLPESSAPCLPPIGYAASSPTQDTHRRLPYPQPQLGAPPSASPRMNQIPLIPPERSSASPIILPPPPGMIRTSGSPAGPLDALADMAGQQYRPPSLPSPRQTQGHSTQARPNQLPQPRNFVQRPYPYYESSTPYTPQYPQYNPTTIPPFHSPHSVQFPSPNLQYGSGARSGSLSQYQSPLPSYGPYQGYHPGQSGPPYPQQSPYSHHTQPFQASFQASPASSIPGKKRPTRPSPINTSVSSTKWKHIRLSDINHPLRSPSPPGPGDISPISRSSSPVPQAPKARGRPPKKKDNGLGKNAKPAEDTLIRGSRGGRGRGGTSASRGTRAASTASSAFAGSNRTQTRSQSVGSNVDDLIAENSTISKRRIKREAPATPAAATDENLSVTSTVNGDPSRLTGRRRGDTLRGPDSPHFDRSPNKRKRPAEGSPETHTPVLNWRPHHVLFSRNFSRTSAHIMNDITAHKLASLFAKPLTERGAPGYKDLIYRPQDLKSIKSAILAGSRAVAAAAETRTTADEAGSPAIGIAKGLATFWVEKTTENMPPKAIVNSAQLEKEICRMFANAVMFNPDPRRVFGPTFRTRARAVARRTMDLNQVKGDETKIEEDDNGGVVRDTREMFEGVEKSVDVWRAAERVGEDVRGKLRGGEDKKEESEVDVLGGEDGRDDRDADGTGMVKKRKKG